MSSLINQCKKISIDYHEIMLEYADSPEISLLEYFRNLGYMGSCTENETMLTVLKGLMLDKLTEYNTFNDRSDACARYLQAQMVIQKEKMNEIIESILYISKKRYLKNINDILSHPFIENYHPGRLTIDFADVLYDVIKPETFVKLARKISEDPYTYAKGWPDLTVLKDKELKFIEVKTTDKLQKSQLKTLPEIKEVLPYNFSVYRLITS